MSHPLEGIDERLKRANENIQNLDIEINRFLENKGHREVLYRDPKDIEKFKQFWGEQIIPARFGTLISEILHGYRAALDNLVWELLRVAGATPSNPNAIEFPIFSQRPTASNKLALFDRKIEGVGDKAHALIEWLQPYNGAAEWQAAHHPLVVLHDMNRFDKHRELTVIGASVQQSPKANLVMLYGIRKDPTTLRDTKVLLGHREVYMGMQLTALVAFRHFGKNAPNLPVILGLRRIEIVVSQTIKRFDEFFPAR